MANYSIDTFSQKDLKEFQENFWLGLGDVTKIRTNNPFDKKDLKNIENPALFIVDLMRKPENFYFTCKHLLNIELAPFQIAIIKELWVRHFPMLVGSRGLGKTFLLAVYSLLRCLFNQNSKVVIAGAAFRQSKFVFEYAESIYNNSPILKDILSYSKLNRPSRDVDRCSFRIGAAKLTALPIGDGSKIRGERATHLICDEMASINVEVAEKVLFGFASVSASPIQNSKEIGKIKALKELGLLSENQEASRRALITSNQTIVSGTADFAWGNFGRYWKRYRSIIESRGDEEKIKMIFDGMIPPGFNWRDYSIIRIPYNLIPEGYMDEKTIGKSKATLHKSLFIQEYGACLAPKTKVITASGIKEIEQVEIGDLVLTHKGRFRKVFKKTFREYEGNIITYKTCGFTENVSVTEDHLFWNGDEKWDKLCNLTETKIPKLKELSGLVELDLTTIVSEGSIPKKIKLNYDFGLICGYYATEDSNVFVNNRLFYEVMEFVYSGTSNNKILKHEILFSNPEFMRGFINSCLGEKGYFSKDNVNIKVNLTGDNLVNQLRLCLSYFGIYCFINQEESFDKNTLQISSKEIKLNILNKKKSEYKGFVYNLEVEEDQSYTLLNATTHNCFSDDTDGFFKMSLIDRCVVKPGDPIVFNSVGGPVNFSASLRGSPGHKYIMAVDPASEQDNFSVVILEIWPDHRRIVYCWTYTRAVHKYRVSKGLVDEHDFFKYCARKIRELHRLFPCEFIAIDRGGGGISIEEALGDFSSIKPGERPIYPIIEEDDKKVTDDFPGEHILVMVSFSKSEWVSDANHGMKKDFEDRVLLFPCCDAISLGIAYEQDKALGRSDEKFNDTLEDCMLEIEDLKYELTTIQYSKTPTGREHWDTPETKDETAGKMKKGRLVKDRYSALLMANKTARDYYKLSQQPKQEYVHVGGFAQVLSAEKEKRRKTTSLYVGPAWFEEQMKNGGNSYGIGVRKK